LRFAAAEIERLRLKVIHLETLLAIARGGMSEPASVEADFALSETPPTTPR
jgi:hypothetical protein